MFANGQGSAASSPPLPQTVTSEAALAAVGRSVFFDASLSASGKLACSSCHDPQYAYGPPPGKAIAVGGKDLNQPGTRAVPSLRYLNQVPQFAEHVVFSDGDDGPGGGLTWDGRAATLHEQARIPLLAANEMANASAADVVEKVRRAPYAEQFRRAFGRNIFGNAESAFAAVVLALEAFQRVPAEFYPYSSKYDAFLRGDADLTPAEERGVALFKDPAKGNCAACHPAVIRDGAPPVFTDYDFMNGGIPRNPQIAANADPQYYDMGLYGPARTDLAGGKEYCGFFRAPSLRNTALRDAFFHNGAFKTLRQVMHFYVERDLFPERYYPRNPDGSIHKYDDLPRGYPDNLDNDPPLDRKPGDKPALSDAEIEDLLAFLQTLTDGYNAP